MESNSNKGKDPRQPNAGWSLDDNAPETGAPLKFSPTFPGAHGYREVIPLTEGFQLVKSDVNFDEDASFPIAAGSVLKFQFRLQGSGLVHLSGHDDIRMHEFSGGVLLQPENIEKIESFKAGEHERAVTLLVSPEYMRNQIGLQTSELPSPLTFYLDSAVDDVFFSRLPMTPEIVAAAQALYQPSVKPNFATLYRQSRAQELLIYCLELLSQSQRDPELNLKSRDIENISEARRILESDIEKPPSIRDLARLVGVNESKLMFGFKQLYNQTIHEFIQTLRMTRAKELLTTTDLSITQIAFEVGYEFSSNFTTAFKRHFGVTPSNARRRRSPFEGKE